MDEPTKQELKAILGINWQDTLINIGAIPFFVGIFMSDIIYVSVLFFLSFVLMLSGMIIYFFNPNRKISKISEKFNKWGSLVIVIFVLLLMVVKFGLLIFT